MVGSQQHSSNKQQQQRAAKLRHEWISRIQTLIRGMGVNLKRYRVQPEAQRNRLCIAINWYGIPWYRAQWFQTIHLHFEKSSNDMLIWQHRRVDVPIATLIQICHFHAFNMVHHIHVNKFLFTCQCPIQPSILTSLRSIRSILSFFEVGRHNVVGGVASPGPRHSPPAVDNPAEGIPVADIPVAGIPVADILAGRSLKKIR